MDAIRALIALGLCFIFADVALGEYKIVCYVTNWGQYRTGRDKFTMDNITRPSLCTHIILAFAKVNGVYNSIQGYEWNDDTPKGTYEQLANLRDATPGLKILLAIGGWNHGTGPFSQVVSTDERIATFSDNVISYIRRIRFDGVDLDWEYPAHRGSPPVDKERFTRLLEILRQRMTHEAAISRLPVMLLTAAVAAPPMIIDSAYEVEKIQLYVDFLNVMAYDMDRGPRLVHHSPLYSRPNDSAADQKWSIHYSMTYWLNKGAPRSKIVLGIPFYGKYFDLLAPDKTSLYEQTLTLPLQIPYYEMCPYLQDQSWTKVWDEVSKSPVIYSKNRWIGYDSLRSIEIKAQYIRSEKLGGGMIWDITQDDFGGVFCNQGVYPLLSKVAGVLKSSQTDCLAGTYGTLTESGCKPCPKGKYQSEKHKTDCIDCEVRKTTYTGGSNAEYFCVDYCSQGFEYGYSEKKCVKCPLGFMRPQVFSSYCVKCPLGYTTLSRGGVACVPLPVGVPVPDIVIVNYHFSLHITMQTLCENKDVVFSAMRSLLKSIVLTLSQTWPPLCTDGCSNLETIDVEGCDAENSRRRRDTSSITVRAVIRNIPQELKSTSSGDTRKVSSVLEEHFFNKDVLGGLEVYGMKYQGMTETLVEKICTESGYVFQDGDCNKCPVGTYLKAVYQTCVPCSVHYYQDQDGQEECVKCPGALMTRTTGATSSQDCLNPCQISKPCGTNGLCILDADSSSVSCMCDESFYGETCHLRQGADTVDTTAIIGGVLGGLGTIVLAGLIVICCCLRKKQLDSNMTRKQGLEIPPSLIARDCLPTPTIIVADPYYMENTFLQSDISFDRPKPRTTPRVVVLESNSSPSEPVIAASKTEVKTPTETPRTTQFDTSLKEEKQVNASIEKLSQDLRL